MKRHLVTIWTFLVVAALGWPGNLTAQTLADYTASTPSGIEAVPPNVLLLMDNSGSMNQMAYQKPFDQTKEYFGLFDPFECYTYGTNKFQPDPAANPTSLGTCPGSYPWSGNLLNYVAMRRVDIVKWVMMGGTCSVGGRDAQGGCRQLIAQNTFASGACCRDQTQAIPVANVAGLMPAGLVPSSGNIHFHLMGSVNPQKGAFCVDDDPNTQTSSDCNDGGTYTETLWQIRVDLFENASGVMQEVGTKARFGLMEFKGAGDGGKVLSDVGSNIQDMLTAIEATTPSTWTPLAESLYEATRYFAQITPAYTNSDYTYTVTNRDPYYFTQPTWAGRSQYVPCCKSFVIIFTDGESTQDLNIPADLRNYAVSLNGPLCTGAGCSNHRTDYPNNGSHYADDVAYWAHSTDLRQGTVPVINEAGKDLPGLQNLTVYTFFAFGSGSDLLQDAAKAGGFEDRNGNNLPDLSEEWDRVINLTGAAGSDGIPDTYFESEDAYQLRERLMATISSILERATSGTSLSVLASSSTGDGSLYQAYYFPTLYQGFNKIKWTGYTQGLFLDSFGNIREDTNADGRLVYTQDQIIKTRFDAATGDVKVDRFQDTDGDGRADSTTPFETVGLREVRPIWEAGKQLALTDPANRKILTWVDSSNDGVVNAGEQIPFTTANSGTLGPYLVAGTAPFTADNIINFIRGAQVAGLRDRQLLVNGTLKVWKYGDPINSTPTIVGPPKERFDVIYGDPSYATFFQQYKNRRQVAYVGANDGMLHGFNGGFYHRGDDPNTSTVTERGYFTRTPTDNSSGQLLGEELWGFIPFQLLPHLRWLTQTDYTHVYYVDLKPKVTDARIFTPDADHPDGWGTILIGGMRMGGSCGACVAGTGAPPMTVTIGGTNRTLYSAYFVLDVTNPEKDPVLLWSFSNSDLGLTTSYPSVVRANPNGSGKSDNTQAKWYMMVGTGMTGYDGSSAQTGMLYAVDLQTGPGPGNSLVVSFPTSNPKSFMGDVVSLDANLDFRVDVVYAGNVIDDGAGTPRWSGKMYRLATGGGVPAPATVWGVSGGSPRQPTLLLGEFACSPSPSCTGPNKVGPITASPTLTMDDAGMVWVFFGTGRYYSIPDKTNIDTQYFFGVKDPVVTSGCTESTVNSCERKDLVNVSSATVCLVCIGGTNQVTGVTGVTTFEGTGTTSLIGLIQSKDGWFTTLPDAGERNLSAPTLLGGTVFFTSFIPGSDICVASGNGFVYALFYKTGSAYKESVIGTEAGAGGNTDVSRRVNLGTGLPSQMAVQIGSQGAGASGSASGSGCSGRITGFIQASTGALNQFCGKPPLSSWSRFISWLDQRI